MNNEFREWMETSETGGRKGNKLERFDLIDPGVMRAIARQFGRGAHKYGDRNYQKGYRWSLSYAAAMRHLNAFWAGEDYDTDPYWAMNDLGDPHHLDAAIFHLMALREFVTSHPEFDNRPVAKSPSWRQEVDHAIQRGDWAEAQKIAETEDANWRESPGTTGTTSSSYGTDEATWPREQGTDLRFLGPV